MAIQIEVEMHKNGSIEITSYKDKHLNESINITKAEAKELVRRLTDLLESD
jgi:hypothetical protein